MLNGLPHELELSNIISVVQNWMTMHVATVSGFIEFLKKYKWWFVRVHVIPLFYLKFVFVTYN